MRSGATGPHVLPHPTTEVAFGWAMALLAPLLWPIDATAASSISDAECSALVAGGMPDLELHSAAVEELPRRRKRYCRVTGVVAHSIRFEIRLPMQGWNHRLLLSGCGAYCGEVLPDQDGYANAINFALERGYATAITDAGHQGSRVRTDWARDNRNAEVLYAHAWVPTATSASRALVRKLYGRGEQYAYFSGCSNGGRTALKVAQRYPELFDGVISGCPTIDLAGAAGLQGLWLDRALVDAEGALRLHEDKIAMLGAAVLDRCDGQDGLLDRIISRPFECDFDPGSLACPSGFAEMGCLSASETEAVRKLYAGVTNSRAEQLYPGLPRGSESYWITSIVATDGAGRRLLGELGNDYFRYLGFDRDPGDAYTTADFDLDRDLPLLEPMRQLFNANDTDLSAFRRAGGKLLLYHGLADPIVVPDVSIAYYARVVEAMAGQADVRDFFRLFLVPGADHCWAVVGRAPDLFDPLQVMERWVEQGIAPERIIAHQYEDSGKTVSPRPAKRTRPLCPYPQQARYTGQGTVLEAGNFVCGGVP